MSFISRFFSQKQPAQQPISNPFRVDIHSHLLPGIDDGVKSFDESVKLVKMFAALGYTKVITTPHVMADFYNNSSETILSLCAQLNERLRAEGIAFTVEASAEYFLDENFSAMLKADTLLSFGNKYVLIETSFMNAPDSFNNDIFNARVKGYQPILAHPERYIYLYDNFNKYIDLSDREVLFQINLASLAGYYSKEAKKIAERLIKEKMVHFVGSDAHGERHLEAVRAAMQTPAFEELTRLDIRNNELL